MFLLVPAYPGCPGSKAVKRSSLLLLLLVFIVAFFLLIVVMVVVCSCLSFYNVYLKLVVNFIEFRVPV